MRLLSRSMRSSVMPILSGCWCARPSAACIRASGERSSCETSCSRRRWPSISARRRALMRSKSRPRSTSSSPLAAPGPKRGARSPAAAASNALRRARMGREKYQASSAANSRLARMVAPITTLWPIRRRGPGPGSIAGAMGSGPPLYCGPSWRPVWRPKLRDTNAMYCSPPGPTRCRAPRQPLFSPARSPSRSSRSTSCIKSGGTARPSSSWRDASSTNSCGRRMSGSRLRRAGKPPWRSVAAAASRAIAAGGPLSSTGVGALACLVA